MIGVWRRWREQRHRHDEFQVLRAIRMLRPSQAAAYPIARLAHMSPVRVYAALERLEAAGSVGSDWEQPTAFLNGRPRRRLYRIAGTRLVETTR